MRPKNSPPYQPRFERWENPHNGRYYVVYINQDLLGDWVVTRVWGSTNTTHGKIVHTPYLSYSAAIRVLKILKEKKLKRGYCHRTSKSHKILNTLPEKS